RTPGPVGAFGVSSAVPVRCVALSGFSPHQAKVHLAFDELPLFGGSESRYQVVERCCVGLREIEQGKEVERLALAQVPAMVQPASNPRQVFRADPDVVGTLLEDSAPLVLRQTPPLRALADWDQGRVGGFGAAEGGLFLDEHLLLGAGDVALIAGDPAQGPLGPSRQGEDGTANDVQALHRRQGVADNCLRRDHLPLAHDPADEREEPRVDGGTSFGRFRACSSGQATETGDHTAGSDRSRKKCPPRLPLFRGGMIDGETINLVGHQAPPFSARRTHRSILPRPIHPVNSLPDGFFPGGQGSYSPGTSIPALRIRKAGPSTETRFASPQPAGHPAVRAALLEGARPVENRAPKRKGGGRRGRGPNRPGAAGPN